MTRERGRHRAPAHAAAQGRNGSSPAVLPLARYELVRTADPEDARERVARVLAEHRLELAGGADGASLDARLHSFRGQDLSLNLLSCGKDVRIVMDAPRRHYAVHVPLSGNAGIRAGFGHIHAEPGVASVVSPHDPLVVRCTPDCRQLIVRIEQAALQARLSELLGEPLREPLWFTPRLDVTRGPGLSWYRVLDLMVGELDLPGSLFTTPGRFAQLERLLMTMLLEVQPHSHSESLRRRGDSGTTRRAPSCPRYVREARQLMDDHPEWQHTIASLASHVSYTTRGLQKGFNRHVGTSPTTYLRRVRLRRARDELLAASPDSTTAEAVAQRWGLRHYGHFAALYRAEFGESPRDTLRR